MRQEPESPMRRRLGLLAYGQQLRGQGMTFNEVKLMLKKEDWSEEDSEPILQAFK